MVTTHAQDVKAFNEKFQLMINDHPVHLTKRKLQERVGFMLEELQEFMSASGIGLFTADGGLNMKLEPVNLPQNIAEQADALVDLVYVAIGTAVMMGLPWEELWADVQRANMSKVRGHTKRGHRIDCVKPEGWVPPQTEAILRAHGLDPYDHTEHDDPIEEDLHV